jgi:hypothetical protein
MRRAETVSEMHLREAVALLIHNQAELATELATHSREAREAEKRFVYIEKRLDELARYLEALPDAIREQIGFKSKPGRS